MRGLVAGMLVLVLSAATPLRADHPDKGKGNKQKGRKAEHAGVAAGFSTDQRAAVRVSFVETHGRGKCPPGLAKKGNGCLPPGLAKKRYVVGRPLPPGIEILPLPVEVSVRVGPPPSGYRYGIVDGDLVKLVVGTLLVVDAIDALVE